MIGISRVSKLAVLWLATASLLVACLPVTESETENEEQPPSARQEESDSPPCQPIELKVGQALTRHLPKNGCDSFEVELDQDSFLHLEAEQVGVDLKIELYSSASQSEPLVIADVQDVREGNWSESLEVLYWVAESEGEYRLEFRGWKGASGEYKLRLEQIRPGGTLERQLAELCNSLYLADGLSDEAAYGPAVREYLNLASLAQSAGASRYAALAYQRLGRLHRKYLEDLPQAELYYGRSLTFYEQINDRFQQSIVLNNLGRVHRAQGRLDEATGFWRRARELKRSAGDRRGEMRSFGNLGNAFRYYGRFELALEAYDKAVEVLSEDASEAGVGIVLNHRGTLYSALGDDLQALADHRRARELGEKAGDLELQATSAAALGRVYSRLGEPEQALRELRLAHDLQVEVRSKLGLARTLQSLALVYEQNGRDEEARATSMQAVDLFLRLKAPTGVAKTQAALGRLQQRAGQLDEALQFQQRALAGFQSVGDSGSEIQTLTEIAQTERAMGRLASALESAKTAVELFEKVRIQAPGFYLRSTYASTHRGLYDLVIHLQMELGKRDPNSGLVKAALQASESSRARSLLDFLGEDSAERRGAADAELLKRERSLLRGLGILEADRLALLDSPGKEQEKEDLHAVEERIEELVRELRSVDNQIALAGSQYSQSSEIVSVAEIQGSLLDDETILLQYYLGLEQSYLWVVSNTGIKAFELPPAAVIEHSARSAYDQIRSRHGREVLRRRSLVELGEMVLEPAKNLLGEKRLLIVADGALHYLPFGGLPDPRAIGREGEHSALLDRHEIVMMPSASALAALRQRLEGRSVPPGLVAVIADPVFEASADSEAVDGGRSPSGRRYERLRFAADEARAIVNLSGPESTLLASRYDATLELVLSPRIRDYKIVHLATHGEFNSEDPELSQLVFSHFDRQGRVLNNSLLAHQVFGLDLPVELVVASACNSALGAEVRGEGLIGLTQGFLSAGAARVMVSLWRVDDRTTAELMEHFYRSLLIDGQAPAAALRSAQLAIKRQAGHGHPYFWAGFVLQGDWRPFELD